jgi:hypothetical protein
MNIHPDTLARAATEVHEQRLVAAETARLIKRAQRSNLEPTKRRWLTALVDSFTGGDVRRRPTADVPTTPATSPITDQHAWSQP